MWFHICLKDQIPVQCGVLCGHIYCYPRFQLEDWRILERMAMLNLMLCRVLFVGLYFASGMLAESLALSLLFVVSEHHNSSGTVRRSFFSVSFISSPIIFIPVNNLCIFKLCSYYGPRGIQVNNSSHTYFCSPFLLEQLNGEP